MNIHSITTVHFIGIGGVGMSGLARIALHRGMTVTGSDFVESDFTRALEKEGVAIAFGEQKKSSVPQSCDMVVYSSAVPATNIERQDADKRKIPSFDYHEALGLFTADAQNIVVTGTHGKTTTTAMLASILSKTSLNPTALVGSYVPAFESNVHLGSNESYVLEGDEYKKGILYLTPTTIVLNNMEWDHPDVYPSESDYLDVFQDFVNKLPADGLFVYNFDDHNIVEHIIKPECPAVSFALDNPQADLFAKNIKIAHGRQIFRLVYKSNELKDFNLVIPGKHNIYNALAATLAALEMGVSQDTIKDALAMFKGAWRRFEHIGTLHGAPVISDYAHHPTEVEATINAAHEFYPDKEILVYFQPHQKARTRLLLHDFAHALDRAQVKEVLLHEIYDVPGRSEDETVSSRDIAKFVKKQKLTYVENFDDAPALLKKKIGKNTLLLVMGAGDIDGYIRSMVNGE